MRTLLTLSCLLWTVAASLACQKPSAEVRPPDSARFVASTEGRVFYPVDCPVWRTLPRTNLRFFPSVGAAEAGGYTRTRNRECGGRAPLASLAPVPSPRPDEEGGRVDGGRVAGVCVVERVVDGDTLDCAGGVRVRLLLVDAPEEGQEDLGLRARLALEERLPPGDSALVELDIQERDPYGRILAHLHQIPGGWVNRMLVREGYAVPLVIPPNVRREAAIRAAADSARRERRGLWRLNGFQCRPADFRAGRCGG